jgi:hypothetical protein
MVSLALKSCWLIEVDPHRGGSISLRPHRGRVYFITTTGLWEPRNRYDRKKDLTRSAGLYKLVKHEPTLTLSSTWNGCAFKRCRKEARVPERAGESTCSGPLSPAAAPRGIPMALRVYQESPGRATCLYATRRPQTISVARGSLRALCCWGSRSVGEGAAEAKSPCTSLAEPGAVQEWSY